jgi:uncharacterized membrane protein YeaQ/YmgE (transglycosylase-associated protein family)
MSFMHILGIILIGSILGRIFAVFTLRKIKGGKYTFMVTGIAGALLFDLLFKTLYERKIISSFFYQEATIIFELIAGALIACYILNLFGKKEKITFE